MTLGRYPIKGAKKKKSTGNVLVKKPETGAKILHSKKWEGERKEMKRKQ